MKALANLLLKGFLLPGTIVLSKIGVSIEDDGGILRSFINMCFWGTATLLIAMQLTG